MALAVKKISCVLASKGVAKTPFKDFCLFSCQKLTKNVTKTKVSTYE